jgi:hypothetical protein
LTTEAVRDVASDLPGLSFGRLRRHPLKGTKDSVQVCTVQRA